MELIPSGSRGPVLLKLQGSRSIDDGNTISIASQQWSFRSQPTARPSNISLFPLRTKAGLSSTVRLTSTTVPITLDQISLFPARSSEAGSSIDADIISAQRFLHQCHPDIDIPDYLLSQIISDNAIALEDTAHELDGSLGLADAQALAFLGPIASGQKRVYAVVCVGGTNRDCLLLHQLDAVSIGDGAASSAHTYSTASDQVKGEARAVESSKLRFLPAHQVERKYKTPILQIFASPNRTHVAVRTHSGTSFLALRHTDYQDRLYLETIREVRYGIDGSSQHQDVCFGTSSPALAASVDRLGNIDLYHLPTEHRSSQPTSSPTEPSALDLPAEGAHTSDTADRQHCESEPPAAASTSSAPPAYPVVTRRVSSQLLSQAIGDDDDETVAQPAADPVGQSADRPMLSKQGPFRIIFGLDDHDLFLLTRHALMHIKLKDTIDASDAASAPQVTTLLRSAFCLTSFRRARFFSMASAQTKSGHLLLAVCSSDAVYWFDLHRPSKPLFATAHHRGDDPTLTLMELPSDSQRTAVSSQQDPEDEALRWVLSSRRNDMVSCYTVRHQLQEGPGIDLLQSNDNGSVSSGARYVLDPAPVLVPSVLSEPELCRPAAPPLFIDVDELLRHDQGPNLLLRLDVTDRGALLTHSLELSFGESASRSSSSQERVLEMEVMQPSTDTLLYIGEATERSSLHDRAKSLSDVKTRLLNYQKLHRTLFAREDDAASQVSQTDLSHATRSNRMLLQNLSSGPTQGNAAVHAATLSLGQLIRDSARYPKDGGREEGATNTGIKSSWSTALGLNNDDPSTGDTARAILDLRSDTRHALSSLGSSSTQRVWSRAADMVSSSHMAGMAAGNSRSGNLPLLSNDIVENALSWSDDQVDVTPYLPTKSTVHDWTGIERRMAQRSLRNASRRMMLDMALKTEIFVRPKARILDEGAPTQRPQQRQGTNWTAFEHRDIYNFVEEQGDTIPPPHIGSVGLSFFAPLRGGDIEAAAGTDVDGSKPGLDEAELESLLPSTSSTARLLLAEWQLGEDPGDYTYLDPFEGLHRLPRASRVIGPTARARSRSFSRASSASTEDRSRSRSRSRSRKQSAAPSLSQSGACASQANSQGPMLPYPPSSVGYSQAAGPPSGAPPTLVSRRKRQHHDIVSRSQPIRAPIQSFVQTPRHDTPPVMRTSAAASSQQAAPRFGFGGSFGDLTPTVSPASSQVGTPTQSRFGASTQIEAGRFGARPVKPDKPPKKKKRASGF